MRTVNLCAVLLAALALAACGGSSNPGPAANLQACKLYNAYENAVASGAVLQSEEVSGNAGRVAHRLVEFLAPGRRGAGHQLPGIPDG